MKRRVAGSLAVFWLGAAFSLAILSCGSPDDGTPAGAIVGRQDLYDYSPSVMQSGNVLQFWWCGQGQNPANPQQNSDSILYESINTQTHQRVGPMIVLAETPNTWDQVFTCNPRVIRGSFTNPLDDGQNYSYEMFYVGTSDGTGQQNNIGAAFSSDGINWHKYPGPLTNAVTTDHYGYGQPVAYNQDGKSRIVLLYEDNQQLQIRHVMATSTDGIHFGTPSVLTANGLDPNNPNPSWGDAGYDPQTDYWYAVHNLTIRYPFTTGNYQEDGQYGTELYRIPNASLINGSTPWQLLKVFDTNRTGYESNFLATLLKDQFGNVNVGSYPRIEVFASISNPRTVWNDSPLKQGQRGDLDRWDIGLPFTWDPQQSTVALNRYGNSTTTEVTTGYVDSAADFKLEKTLGHLYEGPQNGATLAIYNCENAPTDYFLSLAPDCGLKHVVGTEGWGFAKPVNGQQLVPIYNCASSSGYTASNDAACEGQGSGTLLGYALP